MNGDLVAPVMSPPGNSRRLNDRAAAMPSSGILTLDHPQRGGFVVFDVRDYALIDFMPIINQWAALVQIGHTLQIVLKDGAVIELLNFFSYSSAYDDSTGDDLVGTIPDASENLLVKISDSEVISSEDFSHSYWITKTSGSFSSAFAPIEQHAAQRADIGIQQDLLDTVFSPTLPEVFQPILPGLVTQAPLPLVPSPSPPAPVVNRNPVITLAADGGNTTEDASPPAAFGTIEFTDVNLDDAHTISIASEGQGYLGAFRASLSRDATGGGIGQVTWSFLSSAAALQFLADGQRLIQTYTVTIDDGHGGTASQLVTITIEGDNDAAVISGDIAGTGIEAGGVTNGTPGIAVETGDLNGADVDNPNDTWNAVISSAAGDNGFGSFTVTIAGIWTYTLDNSNAAVQALNVGDTLTDTFTVTTVDGTAQVVTITISGTNDAAVISGSATGNVVEAGGVNNGTPGTPTATGDLNSTDVDNISDAWNAVTSPAAGDNGFGSFTVTRAGMWTYTLDNDNADVQALNAGDTLTDTFTVATADGTAQVVIITINGTNDAAVIGGDTTGSVVEAGGIANGTPGTPVATGDLNSTDVDNISDAWNAVAAPAAGNNGFGTYTLTAAGSWTYTLDNSNAAVQALSAGDTLIDTFAVTTVDGTAQVVTITISGTNDAAVIGGDTTGSVVEAGGIANGNPGISDATGDLNAADVDNISDDWIGVSFPIIGDNGFGSFTLTAAGVWTYTLDNNNPAVQALNAGGTLTDTFTAITVDSTAQLITITINGANDAAIISGVASGSVTEAGGVGSGIPGVPIAVGDLDATDVDNPPDSWNAVSSLTAGDDGFGNYILTAAGAWIYILDNSNPAVQALNVGQFLTDTFTATTVDGTSQLITITINGANDAAAITGSTAGTVVEAGGVANGTPGTQVVAGDLNSTDVDNPNDAWAPVSSPAASDNGYGTYTLTTAGLWIYTLDNSNAAVQALNAGQTLIDTFTAITVDGTAQLITVTINGTNDAADVSGDSTGAVVEAGGVGSGLPGVPVAGGDLDAFDVDNPPDDWNAVSSPTISDNGFGAYILTAAGTWIYILDNSNAAVDALDVGDTLTDSFTVTTVDGTTQLITITINGTDDAAVISGDITGTVLEAGGVANGIPGIAAATGNLNAADADNPPDWTAVSTPVASDNGFGTYTLTAAGLWTYTLDDSNAAVQALNVGDTLADTFTVTTVGGTSQVVTITIDGANDAAVVSGNITDNVVEAGGIANGTPGTPTATGDLNSTDVDNPDDVWDAVGILLRGANGFGTYTLTAAGMWSYTLDNSNPAVQALNAGDTLTDTFIAETIDGTTQLISVTIHGTNDAAVIGGPTAGSAVEAGGVANGTPGIPVATGDLNATDVDNPNDAWSAVGFPTASVNGFGTFTLTAPGAWTYTLNNNNATVQALNAGQTLTDTFTAATIDGTTQLITIIINGTNDAAVISGPTAGSVVEAGGVANSAPGTPTATGNLNSTDVDDPDQRFNVVGIPTASANGLGTFTMTVFGIWTYTLDNSNAAVQALNAGQTLTDTFTVTTVDGTSQLVTITINGANDAPVAVADSNAGDPVTEDGVVAGDPTAAGNVLTNDTDVDSGDSRTVTAVNGSALNVGQALVGAYGTLALGADGTWNYALDNTNPSTDALIQGQVATDAFSYTVGDGHGGVSSSSLTITITGANDAPVANDDFANMVPLLRDPTGPFRELRDAPSLLSNDSDVDAGQSALLRLTQVDGVAVSQTPGIETTVIGVYGTLFVQANGTYRYVLNNLDPDTAALAPGELAQEHFDYIASNGAGAGNQAAATLTVEIEGNGNPDVPIVINDPAPYYAFSLDSKSPNSILADLTDIISSGNGQPLDYSLAFYSPTTAASWSWLAGC